METELPAPARCWDSRDRSGIQKGMPQVGLASAEADRAWIAPRFVCRRGLPSKTAAGGEEAEVAYVREDDGRA